MKHGWCLYRARLRGIFSFSYSLIKHNGNSSLSKLSLFDDRGSLEISQSILWIIVPLNQLI